MPVTQSLPTRIVVNCRSPWTGVVRKRHRERSSSAASHRFHRFEGRTLDWAASSSSDRFRVRHSSAEYAGRSTLV